MNLYIFKAFLPPGSGSRRQIFMWIQNRNNGASSSKNPGYGSAKRLLKIVSRQQDVYLQYDGNIE